MLTKTRFLIRLLSVTLYLEQLTSEYIQNVWTLIWEPTIRLREPILQRVAKQISHQTASDAYPDQLRENELWYDEDGTHLFYSAWRVKPATTTSESMVHSSLLKYGARVACWPQTGGI